MIRAGEIRKGSGQIQFSLAVLGVTQLQLRVKLSNANPAPSFTRNEIISLAPEYLSNGYPRCARLGCCCG